MAASLAVGAAATAVAWSLYPDLVALLAAPLRTSGGPARLYMTSLLEGFAVRFRVSLLAGLLLGLPFHLLNALGFLLPGLTPKERRVLGWSLAASAVLVLLSLWYGYAVLIPIAVKVLTGPAFVPSATGLLLGFERNIFLLLQFGLACLVVFQMPLVALLLMAMGVVPRRTMVSAFRYLVVASFVLAAVLTPPDVLSQLLLALPLTFLLGLTLLVARLLRLGEG